MASFTMLLWQRAKRLPFPGLMGCLYSFIPGEVGGRGVESCLVQTKKGQQVQLLWAPTSKGREDPSSTPGKASLPVHPPVLCCSNFYQETSLCCLPATASTPHWAMPSVSTDIWAYPMENLQWPSSHTSRDPVVLPGKRQLQNCCDFCVTTGIGCRNVFVLSQCVALHSQFLLRNAEISIR